MTKRNIMWTISTAALLGCNLAIAQADPLMIVGDDEKLLWDDNGKPVIHPAGKDGVLIVDLANPENPKIVASLPLKNSVVGPPVNLDIDPTGSVALVADSIDVTKEDDTLKMGPDDKIYVIDLKAKPPKLVDTLTVGKQPSGLSFNPTGNLALVANRVDKSIAVLSVKGTEVKLIDTVPMDDIVTHVAFTPDGKHALTTKFNANKVSLLDVNGDKVTYTKLDLPTGLWPYSVAVAPSGKIALVADAGNAGQSDGSVHTVDVVDLEAQPPRIIDRVVVGDAPEGLAFSPKGNIAVAAIYRGSNNKNATTAMAALRSFASTARRSRRSKKSRSVACPSRLCLLLTAATFWSAIISIRTSQFYASTEQRSRTPANVSKSPATRDRRG